MGVDDKKKENENDDLLKQMKRLAITKQLNFLIGSGTSADAVGLMPSFESNKKLNEKIREVSSVLLQESIEDGTVSNNLKTYSDFIKVVVEILNIANARQTPKSANIFTTNYDLFIEKAIDTLPLNSRFVFNDGAKGYFKRELDSSNYNQVVSYKGLNDNYISEIPSISLIKPHGSVNWKRDGDKLYISCSVVAEPVIVEPTGLEGQDTFLNNHFHEMLRLFQLELDKPQTVLFVIGFSFQDKHIAKMINRALRNHELVVYAFGYSDEDKETYMTNLGIDTLPRNLKILTPSDFKQEQFTLNDFNKILSHENMEDVSNEETN